MTYPQFRKMGERELALLTPLNLGVAKMLIINNRDFKERPLIPKCHLQTTI